MSTPKTAAALALAMAFLPLLPTGGATAAELRGRILSQQWCAQCHGVGLNQSSANPDAPSFSAIAVEPSATEFSLRTFLRVPHPTMPNFILKPEDVDDLVEYIISLKPKK